VSDDQHNIPITRLKSRFTKNGRIMPILESSTSEYLLVRTLNTIPNLKALLGDHPPETKAAVIVSLLKLFSVKLSAFNLKECPFWRQRHEIPINDLHYNCCNFCFLAKEGVIDLIKEKLADG